MLSRRQRLIEDKALKEAGDVLIIVGTLWEEHTVLNLLGEEGLKRTIETYLRARQNLSDGDQQ